MSLARAIADRLFHISGANVKAKELIPIAPDGRHAGGYSYDEFVREIEAVIPKKPKSKTTFFDDLVVIADKQNCVLERKSRGYQLYSNSHFVGGDFATLREVEEALRDDDSFQLIETRKLVNRPDRLDKTGLLG